MKLLYLTLGAIGFGSLYTIFRKYQGVAHLSNTNQHFNQPLLQAFAIFIGMSSIALFKGFIPKDKVQSSKPQDNKYLYLLPSFLDVAGTITDTAGLFYTSVSVSQMLKGSILLFTYLITLATSSQKLSKKKHIYMVIIILSLTLIGSSNINISNSQFQSKPLFGNILIIISQFLFALMFMVQQRISKNYNMNVDKAVCWEGIWGTLICGTAVLIFASIETPIHCDIFATCGLLYSNHNLLFALVITALCIGPFNYFGLLITKQTSALQRCIICTSRMIVVWIVSMVMGWQDFNFPQFIGYTILVIGIERFNQQTTTIQIEITDVEQEQKKILEDKQIQEV